MNVRSWTVSIPRLAFVVFLLLFVAVALAAKKCPKCGKVYEDVENYCGWCTNEDGSPVKLRKVEEPKPTPKPQPRQVQGSVVVSGDTLKVSSTPSGAAVKLDGTYVGNTPTTVTGLAVGAHEVLIQQEGYRDYVFTAQVAEPAAPAGMRPLGPNAQGYEEFLWLKDSSVMVRIPAGEFWMGSVESEGETDERPQHKVNLSEFYIDEFEVTNRQFERFVQATGHRTDAEKSGSGWVYDTDSSKWRDKPGASWRDYYGYATENHPVVLVSWNDARAYCDWAGKRLPTEAEWEKAARGTDARKYPWGSSEPTGSRCNFADRNTDFGWSDKNADDGYKFTSPVGSFPNGASPYGVMDMAGNVWEWCNDWYDKGYYGRSANNNPQGPSSGSLRVSRGGSWNNYARILRCGDRNGSEPSYRAYDLGFRCAAVR